MATALNHSQVIKFTTLKNRGRVLVKSNLNIGIGKNRTLTFLNELVNEVATRSANYARFMGGDLPFIYGENQMQSVVAPAIGAISDGMLMETPTIRKTRKKKNEEATPSSSGRVDYECFYRQIAYLIELKHAGIGSSGYLTERFKGNWKTVCEQIKNIKPTLAKDYRQYNENCVRIALHTSYVKVNHNPEKLKNELVDKLLENIIANVQALSPAPNWLAVWKVHPTLAGPFY